MGAVAAHKVAAHKVAAVDSAAAAAAGIGTVTEECIVGGIAELVRKERFQHYEAQQSPLLSSATARATQEVTLAPNSALL
jgi:hypothetical protein